MTWKSIFYFLLPWCTLSEDIYFEKQTSGVAQCIKHSFNNCVQYDLMSRKDWQKYVIDRNTKMKQRFGRLHDPDELIFAKGLVRYVNQTHAGITAHIQPIEGRRQYLRLWAEALTKEVFHPDFQCLLFSGKYYKTDERAHFTTLSKVITDDGAYELWYLDSQRPPTDTKIGSNGKGFEPPPDYAPVDSFKFQRPPGDRALFMDNVYEFLVYFIADYYLPRGHKRQRFVVEIKKTYDSKKEELPGAISAMHMDVIPEGKEEQKYLDLLAKYEYDITIEEAREKRAVLQLLHEKLQVLRAEREFDKFKRRKYDRY